VIDSIEYCQYRTVKADKQHNHNQRGTRVRLEELEAAWNANADESNQWLDLGLDEIVNFAQEIARIECAKICRERADKISGEADRLARDAPDEASALHSTAWQLEVVENEILKRSNTE